ncbi:hypothetical protein [Flavobacterium sp. 14A]|uniref:hypothetical protein n=1 Tax=Flavobacterium sp. 14A TaxID=2735896 RepID=UPI00156FF863|nr:hypothetical protein [Flavobacterium sp. 14A]NRT13593.1 hypothetical protein [Flavobacterium sp. 14A]
MTSESLFLIIPLILILLLFAIGKSRKIFLEHSSEVLIMISSYLFLLTDIRNNNTEIVIFNYNWKELNTILLVSGGITSLISICLSYAFKKRYDSYEDVLNKFNNSKKEFYKLCSDIIRNSFKDFFDNSFSNGRVSIYMHQNNNFILLGRYSNNPNFNSKGRESYPDNEGLISKGWLDNTYVINNIPVWANKGQKYIKCVNLIKSIDTEVIKKMKMKSRSFYIKRIDNEDSRLHHGIIVIEQMDPRPIDSTLIEDILDKHEPNIIVLFKSMNSVK